MTDWASPVPRETLAARAEVLRSIRAYFDAAGLIEVTTPTLASRGVTDCHLDNLTLRHGNLDWFLQTSPEAAMKRLLASGSGSIYQVCPAFRGGEIGRNHNLEFAMLEWYRVGFTLEDLMDDVERLLAALPEAGSGWAGPIDRVDYATVFRRQLGCDPHRATLGALQDLAATLDIDCDHVPATGDAGERSDWLDLLFSEGVQPSLQQPTQVYHYPECQAALAEVATVDGVSVARRFEVFIHGVELANGYQELTDADEMARRFRANNVLRAARGLDEVLIDERLIESTRELPVCAGIAMGIDRLVRLLLGKTALSDVMAFTSERA